MRVLLVDDNLLSSTRLVSALREQRDEVETASTLEAGMEAASRSRADILLVNLTSAAFDAPTLIRTIRQDPQLRSLRIWGFCGHRDVTRRRAALAAGCDWVVANSQVMADLPALLRRPR